MYLIDTNIVSEAMRRTPDPGVIAWLDSINPADQYLPAIAVAEICAGIALHPDQARSAQLADAFSLFVDRGFAGRVLPFDEPAAERYGTIVAGRTRAGRPIAQLDAQIAAIAQAHAHIVVTRNERDFELCGVETHNPFAG